MSRWAWASIWVGCHAATAPTHSVEIGAQSLPDAAIIDAATLDADDAWHGEGCASAASRENVSVDPIVVEGRFYTGRHHCYLDLESRLCFHYPPGATPRRTPGCQRGGASLVTVTASG